MGGDDDSTFDIEGLTQSFLPQFHGISICNWREAVVQNDFVQIHTPILTAQKRL